MDSKNIPPGKKKANLPKTDIIKRNIEKAKAPRVHSKENSKPAAEKVAQRTKSEKHLKPLKASLKESKSNQALKAKTKLKPADKVQKKTKGGKKEVEKVLENTEKPENVEVPEKTSENDSKGHVEQEKTPCGLNDPQAVLGDQVEPQNACSPSRSVQEPRDQGSSKSMKHTPVREIQPKPLPSSYKRRRPSDEDHFDEKCLKST